MKLCSRNGRSGFSGFTLAEAALTIAIVAITLTMCLRYLKGSEFKAAQTRNVKLARDLGLLTLGRIESGLFWEDIESGNGGSYAEDDFPNFFYELALGDDTFPSRDADREMPFDNWAASEEWRRDQDDYDEEEEEEEAQPYEQVRIRITFPQIREYPNELTLERWIPWKQVYGEEDEELNSGSSGDGSGLGTTSGAGK